MKESIGSDLTDKLESLSLNIYKAASEYALTKGIIIADTKFEFGLLNGEVILIDEVLTPDSSRYWPKEDYQPGISPPSFDKQIVRDYLAGLTWDKKPPAPDLPSDVIQRVSDRYQEVFNLLQ